MPLAFIRRWSVFLLVLLPFQAWGQSGASKPPEPDQRMLTAEGLDALVAPIALYPDTLLAEILIASTYPLEVVQADRWVRSKKQLAEDALKTEAEKQPWDKSVKSLVATPSVLEMMSKQLDWTQKLGDAVLAQQGDIMVAVQRLRSKAHDNKKLTSTREQTVSSREEGGKQVIAIEPAVPDAIFVPYYDPAVAYGPWPYSEYPPYYFPPPPWIPSEFITSGIAFGAGYLLGRWTAGGNYWGGGIRWGNGDIDINRPIQIGGDRVTPWRHDPQHRRGVNYANADVRRRFGGNDIRADGDARQALRKKSEAQPRPKDRPGVAQKQSAQGKKTNTPGAKKNAAARKGTAKSSSAKAKKAAQNRGNAHGKTASGRSGNVRRSANHATYNRTYARQQAFSSRGGARNFGGGGPRRRGGRR